MEKYTGEKQEGYVEVLNKRLAELRDAAYYLEESSEATLRLFGKKLDQEQEPCDYDDSIRTQSEAIMDNIDLIAKMLTKAQKNINDFNQEFYGLNLNLNK